MKVSILGATGGTGLCLLRRLLEQGYGVRCLVRDAAKLPAELAGKVELVLGSATDADAVVKSVGDSDVVVVSLGGPPKGPGVDICRHVAVRLDWPVREARRPLRRTGLALTSLLACAAEPRSTSTLRFGGESANPWSLSLARSVLVTTTSTAGDSASSLCSLLRAAFSRIHDRARPRRLSEVYRMVCRQPLCEGVCFVGHSRRTQRQG